MENLKPTAGPKEGYEIKQAIVASAIIVCVVAVLILTYASIEINFPAQASVIKGQVTAISDPWVLARSLLLKTTGVLVGILALMWSLLGIAHVIPGDGLIKIMENSIASSIFYSSIAVAVFYLYCFG
jgi:hypothetical protein